MPMAHGVACGHRGRPYVRVLDAQENGSFHSGLLQSLYCAEIARKRRVHVRRRERVWRRRGRMRLSARGGGRGGQGMSRSQAREGRGEPAGRTGT